VVHCFFIFLAHRHQREDFWFFVRSSEIQVPSPHIRFLSFSPLGPVRSFKTVFTDQPVGFPTFLRSFPSFHPLLFSFLTLPMTKQLRFLPLHYYFILLLFLLPRCLFICAVFCRWPDLSSVGLFKVECFAYRAVPTNWALLSLS